MSVVMTMSNGNGNVGGSVRWQGNGSVRWQWQSNDRGNDHVGDDANDHVGDNGYVRWQSNGYGNGYVGGKAMAMLVVMTLLVEVSRQWQGNGNSFVF